MFSFGHCPNKGGGGPCPNQKILYIYLFLTAKKDVQVARKRGRGGGEEIRAMPERKHYFFGRCSLIGNDHQLAWILVPRWSNGKNANVTARGNFVWGCHRPWVCPAPCVWQQDEGGRGGLWGPRNFLLANPCWFPRVHIHFFYFYTITE